LFEIEQSQSDSGLWRNMGDEQFDILHNGNEIILDLNSP
jgi:hypothetical protein